MVSLNRTTCGDVNLIYLTFVNICDIIFWLAGVDDSADQLEPESGGQRSLDYALQLEPENNQPMDTDYGG